MKGLIGIGLLALTVAFAGCEVIERLNDDDPRLPGTRVELFSDQDVGVPRSANPVSLPQAQNLRSWTQPGATATHAVYHLTLAERPQRLWSRSLGRGNGKAYRVTSAPIVVDGVIYAMDSRLQVTAMRLSDGAVGWRKNLMPVSESDGVFGGGLSFGNGVLLAGTGAGRLYGLNPRTGGVIWQQRLSAPIHGGPTVDGDTVFATTIDNHAAAFDLASGRKRWEHEGREGVTTILGSTPPAAAAGVTYVAYASGEVFALASDTGRVLWSDTVAGLTATARTGMFIDDVGGPPLIDRDRLIVVGGSNRTVSFDIDRGIQAWELPFGGTQMAWPSAQHYFIATDSGRLVAVDRDTGGIAWARSLPKFADAARLDRVEWFGPVLAANRLILASSTGLIITVSPSTGKLLGRVQNRAGFVASPVIAQNTMLLITENGDLVAYK
ncbi:MAG: hypothetical protein CBC49_008340 [Alphaproteobacteria bacterium TMED89]|nr:hypothetical protein [Rhodospirillaceae bacterium]RPH12369.1 MAG: hypothetical protein CBC49_008340 [Alphaproteobacteria bacterium TMED89]